MLVTAILAATVLLIAIPAVVAGGMAALICRVVGAVLRFLPRR